MRASDSSEARIPRGGSGSLSGSLLSGIVGLQLGRTGARLGIKHGGEASKKSNGFLWVGLVLRHVDDVAENGGDILQLRNFPGGKNIEEGRECDRDGLLTLLELLAARLESLDLPPLGRNHIDKGIICLAKTSTEALMSMGCSEPSGSDSSTRRSGNSGPAIPGRDHGQRGQGPPHALPLVRRRQADPGRHLFRWQERPRPAGSRVGRRPRRSSRWLGGSRAPTAVWR
jgi:hypothetical protein